MSNAPSASLEELLEALKGVVSWSVEDGRSGALQPFWEELLILAHAGMNIAVGDGITSGERWTANFLKTKLPAASTLFDVGASTGAYTSLLHSSFGSASRIYSFEPAKVAFLELQIVASTLSNVQAFNLGISDRDGQAPFYSDTPGSQLGSLSQRRLTHFSTNHEAQDDVTLTTLDSFCASHEIKAIDFLKLDVEGHELSVLRGASTLLDRGAIGAIQFEFGGADIDSRTFFQDFYYLLSGQYQLFRILPNALAPIDSYRERLEIFLFANYLALRRDLVI